MPRRLTLSTHAVPTAALAFVALLYAAPLLAGAPQINEIRIDQPSTDNDEYFELFTDPSANLDGLTYLVIGDGSGDSGTIEAVISLAGQTAPADGFFLAAEDATLPGGETPDLTTSLDFENSDNVTHLLVMGFSGANGDDLDTNDDCSLDTTPWTAVVDGVALVEEANGMGMPPSGTECHYGTDLGLPLLGPDGSFVPGQVGRDPDGTGPWIIGVFDPAGGTDSPGATNAGVIPVELQSFSVD
ncbi:MAG: hypothetical protein AAGC60_08035 [Acidobacteriota bacterium]